MNEKQSDVHSELRETLANSEHERWSRWMRYLFSKCVRNDDGSMTIPAGLVVWWQHECYTSYAELTEKQKDSDHKEADRTIDIMLRHIRSISG